jgi:hypothetical protein
MLLPTLGDEVCLDLHRPEGVTSALARRVTATCDLVVIAMTAAASLLHDVGVLFQGTVGLLLRSLGHSPIVPATRHRPAITTEGFRGVCGGTHPCPGRRETRVHIVGTSQGRLMRIGEGLTSAEEMPPTADVVKVVLVEVQARATGSGNHRHRRRLASEV